MGFWVEWATQYVLSKGVDYLLEYLSQSHNEIRLQRQEAKNLPYYKSSERNDIIKYCNGIETALDRFENYIHNNRDNQRRIENFLNRIYYQELKPLAYRMDNVESRLGYVNSWIEYQEQRQQEWDIWRNKTEKRMNQMEKDISAIEYKLLPKFIISVHYQWLEFFENYWNYEFSQTQISEYSKINFEGSGIDIGILLSGFLKLGGGAHFMFDNKMKGETTNGNKQVTLAISGQGYQAYGVISLNLSKAISIEAGAGYYWLDYKIKDYTYYESSIIKWENDGVYALCGIDVGIENIRLYGECDFAIKSKINFAFMNKRVGLRYILPFQMN